MVKNNKPDDESEEVKKSKEALAKCVIESASMYLTGKYRLSNKERSDDR